MVEGALERLRESQPGGKEAETPLYGKRVKRAQEIAGLAGWIATSCRPDAYFAYVVLSQYLAFGLTKTVWRALLRWATYLVETPEVKLTYRACPDDADWAWMLFQNCLAVSLICLSNQPLPNRFKCKPQVQLTLLPAYSGG